MMTIINCNEKRLIGKQFEIIDGHTTIDGGTYSLNKTVVINGITAYDFTNLIIWVKTEE